MFHQTLKLKITFVLAALCLNLFADEIEPFGRLKNELESGHTMLGSIVTRRPRWIFDVVAGARHNELGELYLGIWGASELSHKYNSQREQWFNEVDPRIGYAYKYGFYEGYALTTRIEFQWSEMRYANSPRTYTQWIATETLQTPYVDVYGFAWVVTHPYRAPAYRVGIKKDVPLWEKLSVEPHLYLDMGPERWNRRRFGTWTERPSCYRSGPSAINFHLLLKYQVIDNLLLYAGVRQYDLIVDEIRRQKRAQNTRNAKTDMTYFVFGSVLSF